MKDNANDLNNGSKSSIGKKIMFKAAALVTVICILVISNNAIEAKDNIDKPVKVESSAAINSEVIHNDNEAIKVGTMEYMINTVDHQKDVNNTLLGKDSEYIIITMSIKNNGSKAEAFDAFDMVLQASAKGEKKYIRNISDKTIYNIPSGSQSDVKLVYIVPNDLTDIHIISERNDEINLEVNWTRYCLI